MMKGIYLRPREITLFSLVLALGVLVLGSVVFGWTSPSQNPPNGNVNSLNADTLDGLDSSSFGDATLSNQNTLLTRIGTSTDAASIDGSVMAGLQYLWDNRSAIKSIQRGTITISSGGSNTATITAVDTSKAHLIYLGHSVVNSGEVHPAAAQVRITLTNSTTVTATRDMNAGNITVSFEVVEYW